MVSKEILIQYSDLQQECKEVREKIEKLERQIAKIEADGAVVDKVRGGLGGLQSFKIEGFPYPEYSRKKTLLYARQTTLTNLEIELMETINQVEEFIRKGKAIDVPQEELHIKDRLKYAFEQVCGTAKKVFPYVLVGVGIGAVIHNWIPEEWIIKVLGTGNPFGVIIATICGIPMYADIFGCIPIAEALLAKGARLGVVLSFMMGVTTLSLPSMIMLKKAIKPKLLGIFIAICTVGIILVGYFFNIIQNYII